MESCLKWNSTCQLFSIRLEWCNCWLAALHFDYDDYDHDNCKALRHQKWIVLTSIWKLAELTIFTLQLFSAGPLGIPVCPDAWYDTKRVWTADCQHSDIWDWKNTRRRWAELSYSFFTFSFSKNKRVLLIEGRTGEGGEGGGALARFTNRGKQKITDHGYILYLACLFPWFGKTHSFKMNERVFPNHVNKQARYSF